MRKKLGILTAALVLAMGMTITANAAETKTDTIALTANNTLEYTNGKANIAETFQNMAPGDTRTLTVKVTNNSTHTASFFLSQETVKTLEESNNTAGGAYTFKLSAGADEKNSTSILTTEAGGYTSVNQASADGLKDIDELKDYQFFTELKAGETTNLFLTLSIDGEGFDSTKAVDYSNAVGALNLNFRAYYADVAPTVVTQEQTNHGADNVVTTVTDQVMPSVLGASRTPGNNSKTPGAKTGDMAPIVMTTALLGISAVAIIILTVKKRKAGTEHEKQ